MIRGFTGMLVPVVLVTGVGCRPPRSAYPAALNSERPDDRIAAIRHAADIQDRSVMGILVDRLADEDEAVRFYAIIALEKLTHTRLGYRYQAPEKERERAIERWRKYAGSESPSVRTPAPESQP